MNESDTIFGEQGARTEAGQGAKVPQKVRFVGVAAEVGERTLERLFRQHVGVRPKLYARIARMEWTRALAESHDESQAALAHLGGYADEPHLLRDFRALAGLSPSALLAEDRVGFVQVGGPDPT